MTQEVKSFIENNKYLLDDPEELLKHASSKIFAELYNILKTANLVEDYFDSFYLYYEEGYTDHYPAKCKSFEEAIEKAIQVVSGRNVIIKIYIDSKKDGPVLQGKKQYPSTKIDENTSTQDVVFSDGSVYRIHYVKGTSRYAYPEYDHHEKIK